MYCRDNLAKSQTGTHTRFRLAASYFPMRSLEMERKSNHAIGMLPSFVSTIYSHTVLLNLSSAILLKDINSGGRLYD
jgi:hypothetical protein